MAKLEAMLEQRGIATPREMSEAMARCQLHGGDVTTSLLQFVSADETQLSGALSECYGLPPAAVGLLPAPDDAALRSLPRDVAERYCCFPIEATPGRLVLAVAQPLEPALRDELGFTLGVSIEERVALEVRIRQALSRFYGLPLSARNQRGIARLEGDVEAAGHETPLGIWSDAQLSTLPRPPSELTAARDSQRPPSVRPRSRSETPRQGANAYGASVPPPSSGTRASRRRGPLTLAQARDELGRAGTRNDVLDIFFGFASQFFEYSALFAVHNALAEGLDAWGKGADRETVLGIGVPLDLPSSLSEVAESCKVRLTRLGKEGIDRTLAADLQRQFNAKALVMPVSLRGRCAVLLYADNGEADVVEREVADVIAIAPDLANALGRIILQRKKEIARQKAPENADLAAIARRSQPPRADEPGRVPELLEGIEPIPNENRERSRNNARRSSRPDASPLVPRPEREGGSLSAQPMLSIGPGGDGVPSPPPGDVGARSELGSGDDPVFLLARPQDRGRITAVPPAPRPLPAVAKPPVSITHPAPIIGSRPRLPSVIVDPESADPEASERLTRAAAITRAPTQARSVPVRRPQVPPLADAPRTLSPPAYERPAAKRSRVEERAVSVLSRESEDRVARGPAPPSGAELSEASGLDSPRRPALHPSSVELSEPPPAEPGLAESFAAPSSQPDSADNESPAISPETSPEVSPSDAATNAESDDEVLGPTSSNAWPPPIMDNSPPPRQPPLTALVPIIIADSPKSRRGYTSRTAATARPGSRPGLAKSPPGPASPTQPSPARMRKLDPAANGPVSNDKAPAAAGGPAPIAVASATPVALAAAVPPAEANVEAASPRGAALSEPGSAGANGGSRHTNALARAAARAASTASPRANEPLARAAGDDARVAGAITAPLPGARAALTSNTSSVESPARRDSRPPPAPAVFPPRSSSTPPPLQTRANAGPNTPRLVLPSRSGERISHPPPAPATVPAASTLTTPASARDDFDVAGTRAAAGERTPLASAAPSVAPSSTILGLGAARGGSMARPSPTTPVALATNAVTVAATALASPAPAAAPSFTTRSDSVAVPASAGSSTLIGVAALVPASVAASNTSTALSPASGSPSEPSSETTSSRSVSATNGVSEERAAAGFSEPAANTESPTPRALPAPALSSAPPASMLVADEGPPDSVELAWDALISEPPPAGAILASSAPPAPPAGSLDRPEPDGPAASSVGSTPEQSPALGSGSAGAAEASRPSQPPPSPTSMPFARSASAPPASSAAPSRPIHAVPENPSAAPNPPIHPVPSRPMSASSSNSSAAPSSPIHAVPSAANPAPSNPIPALPNRTIDAAPSSGERTASHPVHAPPSRPGSGTQRAQGASQPASGPAEAGLPSSVPTLAPPSAPGPARSPIVPPPPELDPEIEDLVEQVCQGNLRAVQDLARIGAPSVPQVMARFPGPVISERAGPSSRASECGPLLQALAAIGSPAMPSISLSSENSDARVRRWATLLLGEMPGPEACRAVVQRLADDVPRVHQAALDAARLLLTSDAADLFRKTLFEVAEAEDAPLTLRLRTLEHVAKLKDSASVPRLIAFLAADMEPIVHKALWALTVVTRHDFGRDAGAWTDFWEANQSQHRLEWLIDALDDRDPRLRKAAADELREEAGELFGYTEDLARPERLAAQQEFRRWWQTRGARRYGRG